MNQIKKEFYIGYLVLKNNAELSANALHDLKKYFILLDPIGDRKYILHKDIDTPTLNLLLRELIPIMKSGEILVTNDNNDFLDKFTYFAHKWYFFTYVNEMKAWKRYTDYDIY